MVRGRPYDSIVVSVGPFSRMSCVIILNQYLTDRRHFLEYSFGWLHEKIELENVNRPHQIIINMSINFTLIKMLSTK